ncbi:DDE-type integrase/transposase/recombinase [Acidisoma cladoniae]|uniref:DDE-type integrase/transposase/recombinase n=1 Tax=Acidisoma cladoniae TaxID=3040935 RepID=UPI003D9CB228
MSPAPDGRFALRCSSSRCLGERLRSSLGGDIGPRGCYLNNRAEVSHQPTRRQERQMQRFKSIRQAQRFLSAHSRIHNHFQLSRHLIPADEYRSLRNAAFRVWQDVTRTPSFR